MLTFVSQIAIEAKGISRRHRLGQLNDVDVVERMTKLHKNLSEALKEQGKPVNTKKDENNEDQSGKKNK